MVPETRADDRRVVLASWVTEKSRMTEPGETPASSGNADAAASHTSTCSRARSPVARARRERAFRGRPSPREPCRRRSRACSCRGGSTP